MCSLHRPQLYWFLSIMLFFWTSFLLQMINPATLLFPWSYHLACVCAASTARNACMPALCSPRNNYYRHWQWRKISSGRWRDLSQDLELPRSRTKREPGSNSNPIIPVLSPGCPLVNMTFNHYTSLLRSVLWQWLHEKLSTQEKLK